MRAVHYVFKAPCQDGTSRTWTCTGLTSMSPCWTTIVGLIRYRIYSQSVDLSNASVLLLKPEARSSTVMKNHVVSRVSTLSSLVRISGR